MASWQQLIALLLICLSVVFARIQEPLEPLERIDDINVPMKRFYAWEDAKRSFDSVYDTKDVGEKRKQFYAWAGKRSGAGIDKRKQFYAWAGRK